MSTIYHVGIYCRLSVDDASNSAKANHYIPADESTSIENQRELLSKFAMLNGWIETKTYCDDGYSGGNFQRPGFLEMLEDARKGIINLILVKDLSRLGRDYVEVGRYTNVIFPSLGCRFVSVLDCLDSEGDSTEMLHFRSLMNDYHLRGLSGKIKSVLLSKKKNGQCLSFKAPYGYCKSAEDKHKLVIDDYAAGVVRRIFHLRESGVSVYKITAMLNKEGILPPLVYWYQQNGKEGCKASSAWTTVVVMGILRNEVYLGNLVMNYTGSRSYKDNTLVRKPASEWVRCEGTHEAIISQSVWDAVQKINQAAAQRCAGRSTAPHYLFSGKLICADCGSPMVANKERKRFKNGSRKEYISYHCGRHKSSGQSVCSWHTIYEEPLIRIVTAEIRNRAAEVEVDETAVIEKLRRGVSNYDEQRLTAVKKEISKLRRRVQELENMTAKLYEDKYSGAISENIFIILAKKNEQERLSKTERLNILISEVEKAEMETTAIHNWAAIIRRHLNLHELDVATIDELIDHIEIGERSVVDGQRRQDIRVFYRFVGAID